MARALVTAGADVNAKDAAGGTVLHAAAGGGGLRRTVTSTKAHLAVTQALLAAYEAAASIVKAANDVPALYAALQSLVAPINTFFEKVLVMAEDPDLRHARLALVQHLAALPDGIADLAQMQGF